MTLTKDQIVERIRDRSNFSIQESKNLVELLLESIKSKLESGEEVKISGFGKWAIREKKCRPGRNPHTGQKIEISARRVVTFHPSEKLREAVNSALLDDSKLSYASEDDNDDE
ncbi:MAG: integration host factor subunit alpha [Silvanigrellaceae bacterium]|nr:integration host factor subunit alpha [Silvanigrellaceae bacterium]